MTENVEIDNRNQFSLMFTGTVPKIATRYRTKSIAIKFGVPEIVLDQSFSCIFHKLKTAI
jgi:hypothetical protein